MQRTIITTKVFVLSPPHFRWNSPLYFFGGESGEISPAAAEGRSSEVESWKLSWHSVGPWFVSPPVHSPLVPWRCDIVGVVLVLHKRDIYFFSAEERGCFAFILMFHRLSVHSGVVVNPPVESVPRGCWKIDRKLLKVNSEVEINFEHKFSGLREEEEEEVPRVSEAGINRELVKLCDRNLISPRGRRGLTVPGSVWGVCTSVFSPKPVNIKRKVRSPSSSLPRLLRLLRHLLANCGPPSPTSSGFSIFGWSPGE